MKTITITYTRYILRATKKTHPFSNSWRRETFGKFKTKEEAMRFFDEVLAHNRRYYYCCPTVELKEFSFKKEV